MESLPREHSAQNDHDIVLGDGTGAAENREDLVVQDITNEDGAYDGDVEGQLPYEVEEADTDTEHDSAPATPTIEKSLVKDFRGLRCETPELSSVSISSKAGHIKKRSHDEMHSDTDEERPNASISSTPASKRQRKSMAGRNRDAHHYRRERNETMDVDFVSSPMPAE